MRRKKIKGKQSKLVTVPVKAKSSKSHPEVHLAYITDKEQDLLIKKDLYKSLKGKPNRGPGGLPSLEGDFGPEGKSYSPAEGPDVSAQKATGEGGQTYSGGKPTIDVKKTAENVAIGQGAKLAGAGPYGMLIAPAVRWLGSKFKRTKEPTLTEKTAATEDAPFNQQKKMYDWGPQNGGGGEGGTQMASASAQAAQPIKPKIAPFKPYYMGFDYQQSMNPTTHRSLPMKKGGLSGGKRFGPPPKKGPNPHGKCPFRPDGIRGVGAVEKGRGVKFIGTK